MTPHLDSMALPLAANFGTLDWAIVVVYLMGIVAIGVIVNRYTGS